MMQRTMKVCVGTPLSKESFKLRLAAAWGRVSPKVGKGTMADRMKSDTGTIDRALTEKNLPEAHTIFNSLCADPSALDEILREYGFQLAPLTPDAANDFDLLADAADLHDEHMNAMRDGRRDHRETIRIANKARPVVSKYQAIIEQAEELERKA